MLIRRAVIKLKLPSNVSKYSSVLNLHADILFVFVNICFLDRKRHLAGEGLLGHQLVPLTKVTTHHGPFCQNSGKIQTILLGSPSFHRIMSVPCRITEYSSTCPPFPSYLAISDSHQHCSWGSEVEKTDVKFLEVRFRWLSLVPI